ncbi:MULTISPECIES: hypothetical protein [Streptomyces]|uniref:Uncharacterized protein n=1 Tax=Streptomyces lienomycini TaxID=284035 RepID=A0ABV9X7B8_9ACTN|nr:hypothetical protein [Streptomyces sp. NBC_00334]
MTETEHRFDVTLYWKKVRKHTLDPNPILYGSDVASCPLRACRDALAARPPGAPTARCSSASTCGIAWPRR